MSPTVPPAKTKTKRQSSRRKATKVPRIDHVPAQPTPEKVRAALGHVLQVVAAYERSLEPPPQPRAFDDFADNEVIEAWHQPFPDEAATALLSAVEQLGRSDLEERMRRNNRSHALLLWDDVAAVYAAFKRDTSMSTEGLARNLYRELRDWIPDLPAPVAGMKNPSEPGFAIWRTLAGITREDITIDTGPKDFAANRLTLALAEHLSVRNKRSLYNWQRGYTPTGYAFGTSGAGARAVRLALDLVGVEATIRDRLVDEWRRLDAERISLLPDPASGDEEP